MKKSFIAGIAAALVVALVVVLVVINHKVEMAQREELISSNRAAAVQHAEVIAKEQMARYDELYKEAIDSMAYWYNKAIVDQEELLDDGSRILRVAFYDGRYDDLMGSSIWNWRWSHVEVTEESDLQIGDRIKVQVIGDNWWDAPIVGIDWAD